MADTDYLAASDGTGDAALMHVTSPRVALATIIQVDTVVGVPAFFIGTWGTLLASGFIDPTTKRDFFGHVNAGTLVIDKMAPGNTDGGNTTGQVVVIKPSTPVQNLIGNFVKTALNNFGEGMLINGKIVPSISSNNLIVAIKTLNGVDPSASDVVYVRIGNTVRQLTAALSVTLSAGTNWFSKGASYFAAVESDFFVYLGYNATDGVTLGVSSAPDSLKYSDFSVTNTAWNYAKISTITNAAAADVYENVGRFNAILGVSATFLWTLPATQIIINRPTFETREFSFTDTGGINGTWYYRQTGSKKEVYGLGGSKSTASGTAPSYALTFPGGFFTAIRDAQMAATNLSNTSNVSVDMRGTPTATTANLGLTNLSGATQTGFNLYGHFTGV